MPLRRRCCHSIYSMYLALAYFILPQFIRFFKYYKIKILSVFVGTILMHCLRASGLCAGGSTVQCLQFCTPITNIIQKTQIYILVIVKAINVAQLDFTILNIYIGRECN